MKKVTSKKKAAAGPPTYQGRRQAVKQRKSPAKKQATSAKPKEASAKTKKRSSSTAKPIPRAKAAPSKAQRAKTVAQAPVCETCTIWRPKLIAARNELNQAAAATYDATVRMGKLLDAARRKYGQESGLLYDLDIGITHREDDFCTAFARSSTNQDNGISALEDTMDVAAMTLFHTAHYILDTIIRNWEKNLFAEDGIDKEDDVPDCDEEDDAFDDCDYGFDE